MIALLLFACDPDALKEGSSVEVPTTSHISIDSLENTECQDFEGTPLAGAAVFFAGNFLYTEGTIQGIESAFHLASDSWENGDCEIHISVSGIATDPVGCSSCDLAFDITASMIGGQSDCPEALQEDYQSYQVIYNVQRMDDGTANWFFESGTAFASGTHGDGNLTYLSDPQCQWY
jgi:hypothetical protein